MSKISLGFAAAALFVFSLTAFFSDSAKSQSVLEACVNETASHCSTVLPGNGRLYACIYAHEEKLSEACDEAVADVADQLDIFFEIVRYAKQECRADIQKFCSGIEMGEGRIYSCLKSNSKDLTNDCSEVIGRINLSDE